MSIDKEISRLKRIASGEAVDKSLVTVHQQLVVRIFDQGHDARGSQIGQYSAGYLKKRQKSGLGGSPKVVLEFTGQMRNDFVLTQISNDNWGSGFNNRFNFDKSKWVESTYEKPIFELTKSEENLLDNLISKETNRILNG